MRNALLRWTDGVVLLDKPRGISSQKAVTMVKHACGADKAGHTGTLDPLATGLLAVCLGEATKYSQDLFNADKTYLATVFFGIKTDSGDSEGKELARCPEPSEIFKETFNAQLEQLLPRFRGKIAQVPPMYSAIKKDGRPLYAYAREGEMFDLQAREVHIHELEILSATWPLAVFKVSCSKGTYIRSLVSDLGDALGTGAHMTELRRTRIGHLSIEQGQQLESVHLKTPLRDVDSLISHIPALVVAYPQALRLKMGQRIRLQDIVLEPSPEIVSAPILRIYYLHHRSESLMGLVDLKEGVLHPKRLLATDRLDYLLDPLISLGTLKTDTYSEHHIPNPHF